MADPPTQHGSPFFVEVAGDELDGALYEVAEHGLLVGRSPICDVQLQSREVSRRHAYFYPDGSGCSVKDLGARNGILVNGQRVKERRLEAGDVVEVGPSRLTLLAEGLPATGAATDRSSTRRAPSMPPAEPVLGPAPLHPLIVAAPIFGAMACVHWAFGIGAVVLALLGLWELQGVRSPAGRPLVVAALLMGLAGTGLHAWFGEFAPRIRERQRQAARLQCRDNLIRLAAAIDTYALEYGPGILRRLEVLADVKLLEPDVLNCPGSSVAGGPICAYLFPGAGRLPIAAADVVACDAGLQCHQGEGGWVLRGDGTVEWLRSGRFAHVLRRAAGPAARNGPDDGLIQGER